VVTADRAEFRMDERVLKLNDNVNSLSPDGFLLQGPEVIYTMKNRLLVAPSPVYGQTFLKEAQVWGDTAEASLDDKKVRLNHNARALYQESKHGATHMRGDSAVMDRVEGKVTFVKNVKVEQENVLATSEIGDLYYSPTERGIRYMSLTNDVKIAQPDGKFTRSQIAVTGDKITLYRDTAVVEVTATNAAGAQPKANGKMGKNKEIIPKLNKEDEELIP
jgi:lipopolysaccharide export system protein LptA